MSAERDRLLEVPKGRSPWRHWGPYLSERAWGTVREDYSAGGDAWDFFPHEHARSRAYRWNEDGLAGICDDRQTLCFALAFWNGRDPILKERIFGLTGTEGNHGEDAKEYWFYLDSTPTHSWMRWRYMYPQDEYPYDRLLAENRARGKLDPEFELLDTGLFDSGRYWEITADYAKASPEDLRIRVTVRNAGPQDATLELLPTLWFRNTWSWGIDDRRPSIRLLDGALVAEHAVLGRRVLSGSGYAEALFCENETNSERLFGVPSTTPYPKDGINDHVVHGAATVNPELTGTKAALRYTLSVPAGAVATVELRLADGAGLDADRFRQRDGRPRARGRRVLRGADSRRRERRRGAGAAPGAGRDAVVKAVLPLRHRALAPGRPGGSDAAGLAPARAQPRLDAPQQHGRHLDAGQVGVPVVRGLGSRLPLRRAGARRSGVREGTADPAVPRVVHAPQRAAAGVRVVLQ